MPSKLSDIDSCFYDLDKSVELLLIEKLHEDMAESIQKLSKDVPTVQSFDSIESIINEIGDIDLGTDDFTGDDLSADDFPVVGALALKKSN